MTSRPAPADWKAGLLALMGDARAIAEAGVCNLLEIDPEGRFLTTSDFARLAAQAGGPAWNAASPASGAVVRAVREMAARRDVVRLRRDFYANLHARPVPAPQEAARHLRTGAVVSLQTVLGESGVANNPTNVVYALFPSATGERAEIRSTAPKGAAAPDYGVFRFYGVLPEFLAAGAPEDRLAASGRHPKATPERAMVDWLALAASGVVGAPPPLDLDVDLFDMARLRRLATAVGIEDRLDDWLGARAHAEETDDDDYGIPGLGR